MLPTPVFWPREFHGLHSPWGHKESDTTERLSLVMVKGPGNSALCSRSSVYSLQPHSGSAVACLPNKVSVLTARRFFL